MLRIVELTVSVACGVYLLNQLQVVPNHLLWVYVPTGLGGLILTYLLFVSRLVPRPIAVLGLVGYALLTLGVPLDLLGVLNMNEGMGQLILAPGGLVRVRLHAVLVDRQGIPVRGRNAHVSPMAGRSGRGVIIFGAGPKP